MKSDKWIMVGKTYRGDGSHTIRYECGNVAVESRKIAGQCGKTEVCRETFDRTAGVITEVNNGHDKNTD